MFILFNIEKLREAGDSKEVKKKKPVIFFSLLGKTWLDSAKVEPSVIC